MTEDAPSANPPIVPNGFSRRFTNITRIFAFFVGMSVFVASELGLTPRPISAWWPMGFMVYGILGPDRAIEFLREFRSLLGVKK